jgi:urease accessory protein UreF
LAVASAKIWQRASGVAAIAEIVETDMTSQSIVGQPTAEQLLGDTTLLAEQIGSAEGLVALHGGHGASQFQRVTDLPSLRRFLRDYQSQVLIPLELPAIYRAYGHTNRYEARELIGLDRQLSAEPLVQEFATASRRVGKTQLKRLRPLRDQRLVQRYLHAVETGEAHAWHTLVYGMILSLYSFPLRQGLLNYAQLTTRGFVDSVAGKLRLSESQCCEVTEEVDVEIPAAIEKILADTLGGANLLVV